MNEATLLIEQGYQILDGGTIIGKRGGILKLNKGTGDYIQLNTGRAETQVTYLVHRLVAQIFVPNPNNLPEVNHDNGIKDCNWSWNLKWCTRPQNIQHGFDTGLITPPWRGKSGALHSRSKAVLKYDISGNELQEFGSVREAAKELQIHYNLIYDAIKGKLKSAGGFIWKYKE